MQKRRKKMKRKSIEKSEGATNARGKSQVSVSEVQKGTPRVRDKSRGIR